jgi:uncharacterized protein YndB with AHSA1/START domain
MIDKLFPPPTGEVSVHINASPAEVWDLVTDVTRIGEFSPETFEARWRHGYDHAEVGAKFKGHVKRNGIGPVYWSPCVVTQCEPERVFEFAVGTEDVPVNNWGYRLQPENGGTLVTEYFRLETALPLRVYWALLGGLRKRTNVRGMRATLERMKAVLERG